MSSYHQRLRKILVSAHETESALWDGLSSAEKNQPSQEPWAAKDLIGHITGWRKRYVEFLTLVSGGETPTRCENIEEINLEIYDAYQSLSFDQIRQEYQAASQALLKAFDSVNEEMLTNPDLIEWMGGRTLWNYIAFSDYWHPIDHLLKWLVERGQSEQAKTVQARILEEMTSLDDSDGWRGTNIYNDACYEALFGDRDKAVDLLEQALELNPELTEWSKQDSDLDSLRQMKSYKALYND